MANTCHEERNYCFTCAQYVHGCGTARSYSANANTCHKKGVRYKGTRYEDSKKGKIESTTREAARKSYMEWSAVEFRSIKDNGPHRARHCPTQHGYEVTTAAKEEISIGSKASSKEKEDGKLGGEKPNIKGRIGEGTNATSTSLENMPLPIKPDQIDMESSDDNLFSYDEESEEDKHTSSKSGAQENIRGLLTTSGHKIKEDQIMHLESQEVESDDDSWTRAMRQIQKPYEIRTFGMSFPKPITTTPLTPHLSRCRKFGPKWNPEEKKDRG
jgi:hypothetical protein